VENVLGRTFSVNFLGDLGRAASAAVPELLEELTDPNPNVPRLAPAALGEIGLLAVRTVSQLVARLSGPSPLATFEVAPALTKIRTSVSDRDG